MKNQEETIDNFKKTVRYFVYLHLIVRKISAIYGIPTYHLIHPYSRKYGEFIYDGLQNDKKYEDIAEHIIKYEDIFGF